MNDGNENGLSQCHESGKAGKVGKVVRGLAHTFADVIAAEAVEE